MKALIDTRCLQAATHYGKLGTPTHDKTKEVVDAVCQKRLTGFLEILAEAGVDETVPSDGEIGELRLPLLEQHKCLVLTTRLWSYLPEELDDIVEYCRRGGCILMMSNHAPHHLRDSVLADRFGFSFSEMIYPWHCGAFGVTNLNGESPANHPITAGLGKGITFNNCSIIRIHDPRMMTVLAELPGEPPPNNAFAIAIDRQFGEESGRIVATADSGFIGTKCTAWPGPGQLEEGDNRQFIKNIFSWLCEEE